MSQLQLRYQQVEDQLAWAFSVGPDHRSAFRARLRHFRNLGVPELPKVGSGTQISYSFDHVYQLFFALELGNFGVTPRMARLILERYWSDLKGYCEKARKSGHKEKYFVAFNPCFVGAVLGPEKDADFGLWNFDL